jgi:hypothetical protein
MMLGVETLLTSLLLVGPLPGLPRIAHQQGATRSSALTMLFVLAELILGILILFLFERLKKSEQQRHQEEARFQLPIDKVPATDQKSVGLN